MMRQRGARGTGARVSGRVAAEQRRQRETAKAQPGIAQKPPPSRQKKFTDRWMLVSRHK
jgi:hypothetical protein